MFNNNVRIILVVTCMIFGLINFLDGQHSRAFLLFAAGACFIYGYFRYGSVWLLFQHVKNNRMGQAEKLLLSIKNPKLLSKQQKAYYYFAKACIEESKGDFTSAKIHYAQALDSGLRTTNDKSIANLRLANIHYEEKELNLANDKLKAASELPHKEELNVEINKLRMLINEKITYLKRKES